MKKKFCKKDGSLPGSDKCKGNKRLDTLQDSRRSGGPFINDEVMLNLAGDPIDREATKTWKNCSLQESSVAFPKKRTQFLKLQVTLPSYKRRDKLEINLVTVCKRTYMKEGISYEKFKDSFIGYVAD